MVLERTSVFVELVEVEIGPAEKRGREKSARTESKKAQTMEAGRGELDDDDEAERMEEVEMVYLPAVVDLLQDSRSDLLFQNDGVGGRQFRNCERSRVRRHGF